MKAQNHQMLYLFSLMKVFSFMQNSLKLLLHQFIDPSVKNQKVQKLNKTSHMWRQNKRERWPCFTDFTSMLNVIHFYINSCSCYTDADIVLQTAATSLLRGDIVYFSLDLMPWAAGKFSLIKHGDIRKVKRSSSLVTACVFIYTQRFSSSLNHSISIRYLRTFLHHAWSVVWKHGYTGVLHILRNANRYLELPCGVSKVGS